MKFPLGAMSIGDILDRGLKILSARLPTLYAINLIVLLPTLVLNLVQPFVSPAPESLLLFGLVAIVLGVILSPIASAATLHVIAQEFVDRRVGIGDALQFALRRFGPLLGASILAGLTVGIGFLLCIVPGLVFLLWYIFVGQVVVVEGLGGQAALNRSKQLSEGYRMRVLGMLALVIVISIGIGIAGGLLQAVLPAREAVPTATGFTTVVKPANHVINVAVQYLLNIVAQAFSAVCWTLMYFDFRIRKEGFDLELAAVQQAPEPT